MFHATLAPCFIYNNTSHRAHFFSPGGFSIMFTEFEPGDHVLVITFTDSDGEQASQSFPFTVPPRLGELVMS